MTRATILLICVLAIVLASVGCHRNETLGSAPRSEKASSVAGWKEISSSGVTFRLPSDWKSFELSRENMEKGLGAAFGDDPKFAELRKQVGEASKSGLVKLMAFETSTVKSGFATSCNLIIQDIPLPLTLEQVADANVSQISSIVAPGTKPKLEYTDVRSGKLALIRYELKTQNPAVPLIVSLAYASLKGQRMAVITFGGPVASEEHIRGIAKQAMEDCKFD